MSKGVKIKVDYAGVGEVLKSDEVFAAVEESAAEILGRLPPVGYGMHAFATSQRRGVRISTDSFEAKRDNTKNNTLLKAMPK